MDTCSDMVSTNETKTKVPIKWHSDIVKNNRNTTTIFNYVHSVVNYEER